MDDLKTKVLKALYCCRVLDASWPKCEKCPYMNSELETCKNLNQMHEDAWNVLMVREPVQHGQWLPCSIDKLGDEWL